MKHNPIRRPAALSALGLALTLATASVATAQEPATKPATGTRAIAEAPADGKKPTDLHTATPLPDRHAADDMAQAEYEYEIEPPLQVGDATQGLFAWQRSGELASATPRPIAGSVANRSYERYLKSFEFPIPERMSSIVKSANGSGSGK
ncbi:DUF3613 domain-containing protein [Variovorax paradoxus]|uniref:DUF3613 domain-containing protein n=1 Tax=Variovorax paradoxus TaxID=34073 RepID=UPI0005A51D41|nr:DUF3613 domain-containing protein [Variovorax paradoxus]